MIFPRWTVPILLRLLSLSGLTSAANTAAGHDEFRALTIGFALRPTILPTSSASAAQPSISVDLNFFLQVADTSVSVPIMPLHLLGKKSWNVYNTANIEKVRHDEALARAEEAALEEKQQEEDAARRLAILRGETPPPLAIEDAPKDPSIITSAKRRRDDGERERGYSEGRAPKRPRKKAGEDETDFEMRLAVTQTADSARNNQLVLHDSSKDAPITDRAGNISLFPPTNNAVPSSTKVEKHPEVEAEIGRKKKEAEDAYTLRFSNAAGRNRNGISTSPWYQTSKTLARADKLQDEAEDEEEVGKDVWGNEDPRRKMREQNRIVDNDPLAFMKRGAAQVRTVERERKRWREEKEREVKELEDEDRRRRKRRRAERRERGVRDYDSGEDLDGFTLDGDSRHKDSSERRKHRHAHRDDDGGEEDRDRERERKVRHGHDRDGSNRSHSHRDRNRREDDRHRHGSRRRED